MEREEITKNIGFYPVGTVFNISWDRGNGELSDDYVFLGFEREIPVLKKYEEKKNLESYSKISAFDIFNPDLLIKDLTVIAYKSIESLAQNNFN